ncbi:2-oxo acid dehydrogenase subunit E2 [Porticoccaceae bacterium]|nr:2-oxo acid dehydrogenase subunit E2 [Porticoccaceae bacterium]
MSSIIEITFSADELEGTTAKISAWLLEVGDSIEQGEPLLELETDKVTIEICAPQSGKLTALHKHVGEEVGPQTVLGNLYMGTVVSESNKLDKQENKNVNVDRPQSQESDLKSIEVDSDDDGDTRHLVGPAVRRLLREKSLDIQLISGSGRGGRVTRCDVLAYTDSTSNNLVKPAPQDKLKPAMGSLTGTRLPHTPMRKAIANHMVESLLHTSPHVTSVFDMDMSNIMEHRRWHKKEFSEKGVKLTFTAYFLAASVAGIKAVPQMNAKFHDDALELFDDMNIGVGTALGDDGIVVPVIQQVQHKNLFDIAAGLQQQTEKARAGKLKPIDMRNGTFSISNHGVSGSLFAAPIIINQPQVAILGVGKLEKRVAVEEAGGKNVMVIKPMCYVSLSIDHRAVDAFQTNKFLSAFVGCIEKWGN